MAATNTNSLLTTIGITSPLFLGGVYYANSQITIPCIYPLPPADAAKFFNTFFYRGFRVVAPLAILPALTNAILAYRYRNNSSQRTTYAVAAALSIAPLVWTQLTMTTTINRLLELSAGSAGAVAAGGKEEVVALLESWKGFNFVRAGLATVAGLVALSGVSGLA